MIARQVKKIDGNKVELSWFDAKSESIICNLSEISDLSKILRVEFTL